MKTETRLPHLIEDGYTRAGYIEKLNGLHEEQRFRYRPMLPLVRQQFLLELDRAREAGDGAKIVRIGQEILLLQMVDLELHDEKGKGRPIIVKGDNGLKSGFGLRGAQHTFSLRRSPSVARPLFEARFRNSNE